MVQQKLKPSNIVLIGMSGAGKSTVGKILSDRLDWNYVDVDRELEKIHKVPLQEILDTNDEDAFVEIEADYLKESLNNTKQVIAPGGSIVYAQSVMTSMPSDVLVCYLRADIEQILLRIEVRDRGIVGLKNKSFQELFNERCHLYEKYSSVSIDIGNKIPEEVVKEIINSLL